MTKKAINLSIIVCFIFTSFAPMPLAHADTLNLPAVGQMVNLSPHFDTALIKGLTVHKDNPFLFDFIIDPGQDKASEQAFKEDANRMIKYFFASLTVPDKDIWVNLSPYEKDRIVPASLGQTDMGRELLAQDYLLKQLTASLIYPQDSLGKTFWQKVYSQAKAKYGTSNIAVNTFNKVWILPQRADIYERGQTAYIVQGHLKVMLEEDFKAVDKNKTLGQGPANAMIKPSQADAIGQQAIREVVLPALEKEVNEGKNFAQLRKIFYAQVMAVWFKRNVKQALLNQVYADKSIVKGIDQNDPKTNEMIFQQYLKAYKKGVFNFIKEDQDPITQQEMPRKYFSGGYDGAALSLVPTSTPPTGTDNTMTVSVLAGRPTDASMTARAVTPTATETPVKESATSPSPLQLELSALSSALMGLITKENGVSIYRPSSEAINGSTDLKVVLEKTSIERITNKSFNEIDFKELVSLVMRTISKRTPNAIVKVLDRDEPTGFRDVPELHINFLRNGENIFVDSPERTVRLADVRSAVGDDLLIDAKAAAVFDNNPNGSDAEVKEPGVALGNLKLEAILDKPIAQIDDQEIKDLLIARLKLYFDPYYIPSDIKITRYSDQVLININVVQTRNKANRKSEPNVAYMAVQLNDLLWSGREKILELTTQSEGVREFSLRIARNAYERIEPAGVLKRIMDLYPRFDVELSGLPIPYPQYYSIKIKINETPHVIDLPRAQISPDGGMTSEDLARRINNELTAVLRFDPNVIPLSETQFRGVFNFGEDLSKIETAIRNAVNQVDSNYSIIIISSRFIPGDGTTLVTFEVIGSTITSPAAPAAVTAEGDGKMTSAPNLDAARTSLNAALKSMINKEVGITIQSKDDGTIHFHIPVNWGTFNSTEEQRIKADIVAAIQANFPGTNVTEGLRQTESNHVLYNFEVQKQQVEAETKPLDGPSKTTSANLDAARTSLNAALKSMINEEVGITIQSKDDGTIHLHIPVNWGTFNSTEEQRIKADIVAAIQANFPGTNVTEGLRQTESNHVLYNFEVIKSTKTSPATPAAKSADGDNGMITPGGIDLSQQDGALTVTKDANGGVSVFVDPKLIERIRRQGLLEINPVIINIQQTNSSLLFG